MIPLPAFLFLSKNIFHHFQIALESEILDLNFFSIPIQILYIISNALAHYLCITCVFILTTECTSLSVTLTITLRKFSSLMLSIFYFRHNFTFFHWMGTFFIIIGTIIFTEIFPKIKDKFYSENVDKFYLNNSELNHKSLKEKFVAKFNFVPTHYKHLNSEES
jgi:UDP-xylose/UDP-N-acetylglucosamine transporter B4